jgi:tetratricopeptide (TPR) repeat protein
MFQSSTAQYMPTWFPNFIASSYMTIDNFDQQLDHIVKTLESLINQEQSDNTVNEKLRLVHLGYICFQKENFVDALNHWEEAIEIESHMHYSAQIMYNGVIYVQMAAAYFK